MGLFVKTTYADTCVGLDVLYYLLVVVVGGGRGKVKLTECPTLHVSEYPVDSVQQLELLHVALGSPIGHDMEIDSDRTTILQPMHNGVPLYGSKLYEHCRTPP